MGVTLRYPYEVRDESEYFDEIPSEKVTKDMLDLASHIVKTKTGHFNPKKFEDHYEDALKDLLRKKEHGEKIEAPRKDESVKVIMDALRRSAKSRTAEHSSPRRSAVRPRKNRKKASGSRQRKAS
jgi:DNA end-binding protein Ku